MKKTILTYSIILILTACSKSSSQPDPEPPVNPPTAADTSLKKDLPFPAGAAVNVNLLKTKEAYRSLVIKEYNSLTPENAMKIGALHPAKDTYTWTDADYLVSFAQQNSQRVHGHTLVWHQSLPDWITNFVGDSAAWESLLKTHIQTVVTHFKGKVASWDVVNEAINDDGTLRNSIWRQKLGDDYIARSFQYAHDADPDALLFYNDYGHEYGVTKRTAILNLVNNLKTRGIPIHGIGLQMHTRYTQADNNLANAINSAAATGLKVHISELDIAMNPDNTANLVFTAALAEQQKQKYLFISKTFNAISKAQQYGLTTWNVTDADSWIPSTYNRNDWPLLFDSNYKRKPAYYGVLLGVQ
ncbi:MAG: endo-1,4-beta-xylanase [Chitinophagaceae bacterium]